MRKIYSDRNEILNKKKLLTALLVSVTVGFTACGTVAEDASGEIESRAMGNTAGNASSEAPALAGNAPQTGVQTMLQTDPQTAYQEGIAGDAPDRPADSATDSTSDSASDSIRAENLPESGELPQPYREYVVVLEQILRERTDPNGNDYSDLYENTKFENNRFAILDVDRDGRQELLFNFNESSMAGMREVVYEYDEETDTLREELVAWVDTVYYNNGMVKVAASHNHGRDPYERGTWPYLLYQYDEETDSYQLLYDIDAWDGQVIPEGFPSELDTDGDELLYRIMEDGEANAERDEIILNQEEYDSWVEEMMPAWSEIEVTYHPMTEEAVESISAAYAQAAAYAAQSDDWFIKAGYGDGFPDYLLYDLDKDGSPELITSVMQGTGRYSENCFYSLTDTGEPVKLPLVRLCDGEEKENHIDFDLGGWYQIKAYQDQNGIIYYEGHDYERDGIYGGYNEEGFYYLKDGTVYQDSIRGYSEIFANREGNEEREIHYHDMISDEEITEVRYEEIRENYIQNMTEKKVHQGWVYFTLEETSEGEVPEEIIRIRLLESFLGSV